MNVKILLIRRIAVVSCICLLAAALYVIDCSRRDMQQQLQTVSETLARQSQWQLLKIASGYEPATRFPDWDIYAQTGSLAGLCARFINAEGITVRSVCRGPELYRQSRPDWFAKLYRHIYAADMEISQPVLVQKAHYGTIAVSAAPEKAIDAAWRDIAALFGLAAATLAAASLMLYLTLNRALRPVETILAALDNMERGDLATRLPAFELFELQRISAAVNRLAANLEQNIAARAALSAELLSVQEQERRHLARELHDEFGQCLAGINALAASISQSAQFDCPVLLSESEHIGRIASHMLEQLRGMLLRLRPPGIDELGFGACLRALVRNCNAYGGGKTRYNLDLCNSCEQLPDPVAVHVYRIVQECLTNAAKHAGATLVNVKIMRTWPDAATAPSSVELAVEDNGIAAAEVPRQPGTGLLGIRERVAALGGQVQIYHGAAGGFGIRATFPCAFPATALQQ